MKRRPRCSAIALASLAAALFAATSTARAQDGGPVIIGTRRQTQPFTLNIVRAAAEVEYTLNQSNVTPAGSIANRFSENRIEETFTLAAVGSIIHPNFVDLKLEGTFGLQQIWDDNNGQKEFQNGILGEYDVSATILRKEIAPLTLYSRRTQEYISRQFGPTVESILMTTGAIWDIRSQKIPTRFEAYRLDETQTANDQTADFDLSQNTFTWHSDTRPTPAHTINWDYAFNNVHESSGLGNGSNFNSHDASLSHVWQFGKALQNDLTSSFSYFNQSGTFDIDRVLFNEVLRFRHSESFETRYQYTLNKNQYNISDEFINRLEAGFLHRLYKSLVTTGRTGVQWIDRTPDGDTFEYYGDLNFDYTKKVPRGTFNALLTLAGDVQNNDASSGAVQIANRPETFLDPQPIIIPGNAIVPASVLVTDPSGLIVFTQGTDYLLTTFPDRVQLNRIIGSRLADGQSILVSYQLLPQAQNTTVTGDVSFGVRYTLDEGIFKGLSVYARYATQAQNIDSPVPSTLLENSYSDYLIGAEYHIGALTLGAEQQWHDSTIYPFDASRLWARYTKRLTFDTTFNVNSAYTIIQYPEGDNRVDLFTTSVQIDQRFSRRLYASLTLLYRYEDDRFQGVVRGLEEHLEVRWTYRQTSAYVNLRNSNLDGDTQDSNFQFVQVGVRREF